MFNVYVIVYPLLGVEVVGSFKSFKVHKISSKDENASRNSKDEEVFDRHAFILFRTLAN